ncbi:ligand-binding sensor domain-containing diguanylate cyclase [Salinivibrio sp. ES.052]|uniref:ligand-binding sensor domain-containing diguanylate cyclase n=1 Tax=Salinivibrio sp. ES.052 TaxID=1882823 RepID=UPI00092B36C6|nr:ligand-binding sensor domain-containing diguanylate cyclase [Salinivibrio sp. ES.052]SIO34643.1 diguanylate cyclase (GGDEF) domain-containing protein [Salinivibrio sp. ES.052]
MHLRNTLRHIPPQLSRRLVCITLLCWLGLAGHLVTPSYADDNQLSDYFIETWTSANGLPHNSINAIAQTSDGYLWFATWEGVARYNGLEFVRFDRGPDTQMKDSGTRALATGPDNQLYAGGARGSLVMRQGFSWQSLPTAPSLINDALHDQTGGLWLAVEGMGIAYYAPEQLSQADPTPQTFIPTISSYHLTQTSNGNIYAATEKGVYQLSLQNGATPLSFHNLFRKAFYVSSGQEGSLLVGSENGAWRYKNSRWTPLASELLHQAITMIEQDSRGAYWFGTLSHGIAHMKGHHIDFLEEHRGLPNNRILSWFEDNEGSIWIGTNGGAMRLRYAPFVTLTKDNGLAGNYVRTVLAGDEHTVWAGTSEGLSRIETLTGTAHVLADNISVLSLAHREQGGLWVGTYQQGLYYWHQGSLTPAKAINAQLPDNEIRAIVEHDGRLWIGTPRGLVEFQKEQGGPTNAPPRVYQQRNLYHSQNSALPGSYVMSLAVDNRGKLWIGTGSGASYLQKETLTTLDLSNQEAAQYVFGFFSEPGYVWMATDRGLVRYRQSDGHISLVGRPQGLPIDKFFQIIKGNDQSFWLSSNRGIWRINYYQAHQVADKTRSRIDFEHYDQSDGMMNSQANGGSNPAATKTPSGEIVFATAKGVTSVNPARLSRLLSQPLPIVMQKVQFDSQEINPESVGRASSETNRVLFSYAALGYTMPEQIQYRTKLEGFESGWAYRHENHVAEYTNLPPGNYTFKVSARYPYSEWSDDILSYRFSVMPSFWQRADVRAFSFLLLVTLAYGVFMWRIRHMKKRELHLKALVEKKTHALQTQADDFERLSKEDALTGLANRRAFDEYWHLAFDEANQSGDPLQVAILDIDHFKRINDQHSHLVGDQIIQCIGHFLDNERAHLRHIARWGGEEFTLLFAGTPADGYQYFDDLRRRIAVLNLDDIAPSLTVTVSIGMAGNHQASNYVEGLKQADQALYRAKRAGRNCVRQSDSAY